MTRPKCDRAMRQKLAGPAVVQQQPQAGIDDEQCGRKAFEDRDEGARLLVRREEGELFRDGLALGECGGSGDMRVRFSERLTDPCC